MFTFNASHFPRSWANLENWAIRVDLNLAHIGAFIPIVYKYWNQMELRSWLQLSLLLPSIYETIAKTEQLYTAEFRPLDSNQELNFTLAPWLCRIQESLILKTVSNASVLWIAKHLPQKHLGNDVLQSNVKPAMTESEAVAATFVLNTTFPLH